MVFPIELFDTFASNGFVTVKDGNVVLKCNGNKVTAYAGLVTKKPYIIDGSGFTLKLKYPDSELKWGSYWEAGVYIQVTFDKVTAINPMYLFGTNAELEIGQRKMNDMSYTVVKRERGAVVFSTIRYDKAYEEIIFRQSGNRMQVKIKSGEEEITVGEFEGLGTSPVYIYIQAWGGYGKDYTATLTDFQMVNPMVTAAYELSSIVLSLVLAMFVLMVMRVVIKRIKIKE